MSQEDGSDKKQRARLCGPSLSPGKGCEFHPEFEGNHYNWEQHDFSLSLRITVLNQSSSPFDMEIHLGNSIPHHPTPYSFIIYINLFKAVINPIVH